MKALILESINQPMNFKEVLDPTQQEGESIIKIRAAAINHRDVWISKGMYAGIKTPIILGSDLCGILNGHEVIVNPAWHWGNNEAFQSKKFQVLGMPVNGSFADYISVPTNYIHDKPKHLDSIEAAALPLAGLTAYRALFVKAQLNKGDKLLITGIGGGVSLMALQLAVAAGIEVYVTSSSEDKILRAISLGASGGINYKHNNWHKLIIEKYGIDGFDVLLDGAGGIGFNKLLKLANYGARIAVYGGTRGNYTEVNPQMLFWKQISLLGTTMGSDDDFSAMLHFINQLKVKPVIDKIYKMEDGNHAFHRMDRGEQFGKIILKN